MIAGAFLLGLLGSMHCVGMCGPIALALPIGQRTGFSKVFAILTYNFGRIVTYAILGYILGSLGKIFVFYGWQRWLSITMGFLILAFLIVPSQNYSSFKVFSFWFRWVNKIKSSLGKRFSNADLSNLFTIGVLNGFLPCGLVYMAAAGAVAEGNPLKGSLFMALFGAGTIPAMFSISYAKGFITLEMRKKINRLIPYMIAVMGCLFIVRGMNLGIPYLSPKVEMHGLVKESCCH